MSLNKLRTSVMNTIIMPHIMAPVSIERLILLLYVMVITIMIIREYIGKKGGIIYFIL